MPYGLRRHHYVEGIGNRGRFEKQWKTPQLTHAQTTQTIAWYNDISCLDSCLFNELNTLNGGNVESPRVTLTRVSAGRPLASTKLRPGRKSWTSEDSEDEVRQKALANARQRQWSKLRKLRMPMQSSMSQKWHWATQVHCLVNLSCVIFHHFLMVEKSFLACRLQSFNRLNNLLTVALAHPHSLSPQASNPPSEPHTRDLPIGSTQLDSAPQERPGQHCNWIAGAMADGVHVHLPLKHCKPQKVGANQKESRAWNIQSMDKAILEGSQSHNSRDLLFLDEGRQRKTTLQIWLPFGINFPARGLVNHRNPLELC